MVKTKRNLKMTISDEGLTKLHIDISDKAGAILNERLFFLSTGLLHTTMEKSELEALGYEITEDTYIVVPFFRIGAYDFHNTQVYIGESNVLGADILRWIDFSTNRKDSSLEVDLIPNLQNIVAKGLNPRIKLSFNSRIKSSVYSGVENWLTINEIDSKFPNSWVLLWGGDFSDDFGGEVLWHSETEIPETMQDNTFLYCNKSIAQQNLIIVNFDNHMFCRQYTNPDESYLAEIKKLEETLESPTINRFYYDPISRQGKLFAKDTVTLTEETVVPIGPVLSQQQIDMLLKQYSL